MNWLKKGPELKLPKLGRRGGGAPKPKVPDVIVDLYWDLRERRLLPLVALAIVAIVAVPFLLGGEEPAERVPVTLGGAAAGGAAASSVELAVVEAKPGLRDYRKRLDGRRPTDPFKQRFTSPVLKGTQLGNDAGGGDESSTSTVTKTSTSKTTTKTTKTVNGKSTTTETTTTGSPGGAGQDGIVLYSFAVKLKIMRIETKPDGGKEKTPIVRKRVLPPAPLPSEKEQVVTYMGLSPKTRKPLLLISDQVTAVYGEGSCLSGSGSCQLLEVEPGLPITFVYGPASVRYKVNVLDVRPVVLDDPAQG